MHWYTGYYMDYCYFRILHFLLAYKPVYIYWYPCMFIEFAKCTAFTPYTLDIWKMYWLVWLNMGSQAYLLIVCIYWIHCLTKLYIGRLSCALAVWPSHRLVCLYTGINNDALARLPGWLWNALVLVQTVVVVVWVRYIYWVKWPPSLLCTHELVGRDIHWFP